MIKVVYISNHNALNQLLYYFTPLYIGGSKVVVKAQHGTTLKQVKVLFKVVK